MRTKPLHKIVEVDWVDITSRQNWEDIEDALTFEPVLIKTVGYLLNKDAKNIRLVMSQSNDMGVAIVKIIPLGVVRKIKVIR